MSRFIHSTSESQKLHIERTMIESKEETIDIVVRSSPENEVDELQGKDAVRKTAACTRRTFLVLLLLFVSVAGMMFGIGYWAGETTQEEAEAPSLTTSPSPTESPTLPPTYSPPPPSNITVAVYYYPWHGNNFHGGKYLRGDLVPRQTPVLGEYDDSNPALISRHLAWSRHSNIRVWVTSWWGPNTYEDNTTRNAILPHREIGDLKVAVHYESSGRSRNATGHVNRTLILERVGSDVAYLCENYFGHPSYLRIDDKPVLVFYLSRLYEQLGLMREAASIMRNAAVDCGETGIYIVGDHAFNTHFFAFDYLDAVTNYDVYGSTPQTNEYAYQTGLDQYFAKQQEWRNRSLQQGVDYIPAVSPGFNDRSVRIEVDHVPLSRKMSPDSPFGSLFEGYLRQALKMVSTSTGNMVLVNSWNEWHEDTQIEPAIGFSSSQPFSLTQGLEYEGYGFLYLDILRKLTVTLTE